MHFDQGYFEEKQLDRAYDRRLAKRLLPFIMPYRLWLALSVFLVVVIALVDLSVPLITKTAIDRYIVPVEGTEQVFSGERARLLKVDMHDERASSTAGKYPGLFRFEGDAAYIPYDRLQEIDREDLADLRGEDIRGVVFSALLLLTAVSLNFLLNFLQVLIMEYTGQNILHDLRMRLFDHIQSLSVSFFTKNTTGRLVTRVTNDVQNMHEMFTTVLTFIFKDLFLLAGIVATLLWINWRLACVTLSVLPFVAIASLLFAKRSRDAFRILRLKAAEINSRFAETVGGMKVVQLFCHEKKTEEDFNRLNHENFRAGMVQINVFAVFMPVIEVLGSTALALIIYYGGSSVIRETLTIGALVAFISYMKMFFRPVRDIAEKYNIMQNAFSSAERIFLIFDSNERIGGGTAGDMPAETLAGPIERVTFENVSFSYVENEAVLKDISFTIRSGRTMAVVGPTGAGKTSLINLMIRFYDPDSGRILVNGKDIRNVDMKTLRSGIALVSQDPFLFSGTIRENIQKNGENIPDKQMDRIIDMARCRDIVDKLENGLDTPLSEGAGILSSGERQLLSIARAFAADPEIIILDEATSYIDTASEAKVQAALADLMESRTTVIIAHRISTARIADTIVVLKNGEIIESGSHNELINRGGFYFRLNQLEK